MDETAFSAQSRSAIERTKESDGCPNAAMEWIVAFFPVKPTEPKECD